MTEAVQARPGLKPMNNLPGLLDKLRVFGRAEIEHAARAVCAGVVDGWVRPSPFGFLRIRAVEEAKRPPAEREYFVDRPAGPPEPVDDDWGYGS